MHYVHHSDQLGSAVRLSDGTGALVNITAYAPFGEELELTMEPIPENLDLTTPLVNAIEHCKARNTIRISASVEGISDIFCEAGERIKFLPGFKVQRGAKFKANINEVLKTVINFGSTKPRYKFAGKELDSSGLYYYGARYYDPELGRFISPDTILDGLNRYAYCGNNPINYVDPTGNDYSSYGEAFGYSYSNYESGAPVGYGGSDSSCGPNGGSISYSDENGITHTITLTTYTYDGVTVPITKFSFTSPQESGSGSSVSGLPSSPAQANPPPDPTANPDYWKHGPEGVNPLDIIAPNGRMWREMQSQRDVCWQWPEYSDFNQFTQYRRFRTSGSDGGDFFINWSLSLNNAMRHLFNTAFQTIHRVDQAPKGVGAPSLMETGCIITYGGGGQINISGLANGARSVIGSITLQSGKAAVGAVAGKTVAELAKELGIDINTLKDGLGGVEKGQAVLNVLDATLKASGVPAAERVEMLKNLIGGTGW